MHLGELAISLLAVLPRTTMSSNAVRVVALQAEGARSQTGNGTQCLKLAGAQRLPMLVLARTILIVVVTMTQEVKNVAQLPHFHVLKVPGGVLENGVDAITLGVPKNLVDIGSRNCRRSWLAVDGRECCWCGIRRSLGIVHRGGRGGRGSEGHASLEVDELLSTEDLLQSDGTKTPLDLRQFVSERRSFQEGDPPCDFTVLNDRLK